MCSRGLPLLVLLTLLSLGCGGDGLPRVEGLVTLDGEPLPNARVSFYPTNGRAALGLTDARGQYRLRTSSQQAGVAPGNYIVTVSTRTPSTQPAGIDAESVPGKEETLPPRYSSREQSTLREEVTPAGEQIDFSLTTDG